MTKKINQRIFLGLKADSERNVTIATMPQEEKLILSPPFTVSIRFYLWKLEECRIIKQSPCFSFLLSGGQLKFLCQGASTVSSGKRTDGRDKLFEKSFNVVDVACDGNKLLLYINGFLAETADFSLAAISTQLTQPLRMELGGSKNCYLQWFRYYKRCLTASAILKNIIAEKHDKPELFIDFTGKECKSMGEVCANLSCQGNCTPVNLNVCFSPGKKGYAAMLPPRALCGEEATSLYVSLYLESVGTMREVLFCSGSKEQAEDWFAIIIRYTKVGEAYLDVEAGSQTLTGNQKLPVGQWFDVGIVLGTDKLTVYVDGDGYGEREEFKPVKNLSCSLWYFGNRGKTERENVGHALTGYLDTFALMEGELTKEEYTVLLTSSLSSDSNGVNVLLQFFDGGMEEMVSASDLLTCHDAGMVLLESSSYDEVQPQYIPARCQAEYTPSSEYEKWQIAECAVLYKGFLEETYGIDVPDSVVDVAQMAVVGGLAGYIASNILPLPQTQTMFAGDLNMDMEMELEDLPLETYEEFLEGIHRNGAGRGMWNRTAGGGGAGGNGGFYQIMTDTAFGAGAGAGFNFTGEGFAAGLGAALLAAVALSSKRPNKPIPTNPKIRDCAVKSLLFAHSPGEPAKSAVYIRSDSSAQALVPEWSVTQNSTNNPGLCAYIEQDKPETWLECRLVYTGEPISGTLSVSCSENSLISSIHAESTVALTAGETVVKCSVQWKSGTRVGSGAVPITLRFTVTFSDGRSCDGGSAAVSVYVLERQPLSPWNAAVKTAAPTKTMLEFALNGYGVGMTAEKYAEMLCKKLKGYRNIKAVNSHGFASLKRTSRKITLDLEQAEKRIETMMNPQGTGKAELSILDAGALLMDSSLLLGHSCALAGLGSGMGVIMRETERESSIFLASDKALDGTSMAADSELKRYGLNPQTEYFLFQTKNAQKKERYADFWLRELVLCGLPFEPEGENGDFSGKEETGTIRADLILTGTSCVVTARYFTLLHEKKSVAIASVLKSGSDSNGITSLNRNRLIYFCKGSLQFELHSSVRLPFDAVIDQVMPPSGENDRCHYISQTTLGYKVCAIINTANDELKSQAQACESNMRNRFNTLINAAFPTNSCINTVTQRFLIGANAIMDQLCNIYNDLANREIDDPFAMSSNDSIEELANFMIENLNNSIENLRYGEKGWNRNISDQFDPGSWFSFYENRVWAYEGGALPSSETYGEFCKNHRGAGTMPTVVPTENGIYFDSIPDSIRLCCILSLPVHPCENFGVLDYVAVISSEEHLPFHIPGSSDNQFVKTKQFNCSFFNERSKIFRRNADLNFDGWK